MGRKPSEIPKNNIVTVRLSKLEYAALKNMAGRANKNMADFVRDIILDLADRNKQIPIKEDPVILMRNWPPFGKWSNHSDRDIMWHFRSDYNLDNALLYLLKTYGFNKTSVLIRKIIENYEYEEGYIKCDW